MSLLHPITKSAMNQSSAFADRFIADMQASYAADLSPRAARKWYDHTQAFEPNAPAVNGYAVLATDAATTSDYKTAMVSKLIHFCGALHITQWYLISMHRRSLADFPFESFAKRNAFRRLCTVQGEEYAYAFATTDLNTLLPLFLFSRAYDVPAAFFISADGTPLAFSICDDGNLHLSFYEDHKQAISDAANTAGFVYGDIDLCAEYSTQNFC